VPDRRADHGLIVFEEMGVTGFSLLLEFAESFGEGFRKVGGDGRSLRNDESLGHEADLGRERWVFWRGMIP